MRIATSILALALLAGSSAAGPDHNCTCLFSGGTVKEGETACIDTVKGKQLARCGMFLNNTTWVPLDKPCVPDKTAEPAKAPQKPAVSG
jgi:hypothetical protein